MRLRDKVAIVTGGSSGFGRATSIRFGEEGARVVVADLDEAWGKQTVALVEQAGGQASLVVADVATTAGAGAVVGHALERFGSLDVLVNNAGIAQRDPEDSWNTLRGDLGRSPSRQSQERLSLLEVRHPAHARARQLARSSTSPRSRRRVPSAGRPTVPRRVGSSATRGRSHARSPRAASGSIACRRATCGPRCRPASVGARRWKSRKARWRVSRRCHR